MQSDFHHGLLGVTAKDHVVQLLGLDAADDVADVRLERDRLAVLTLVDSLIAGRERVLPRAIEAS